MVFEESSCLSYITMFCTVLLTVSGKWLVVATFQIGDPHHPQTGSCCQEGVSGYELFKYRLSEEFLAGLHFLSLVGKQNPDLPKRTWSKLLSWTAPVCWPLQEETGNRNRLSTRIKGNTGQGLPNSWMEASMLVLFWMNGSHPSGQEERYLYALKASKIPINAFLLVYLKSF